MEKDYNCSEDKRIRNIQVEKEYKILKDCKFEIDRNGGYGKIVLTIHDKKISKGEITFNKFFT